VFLQSEAGSLEASSDGAADVAGASEVAGASDVAGAALELVPTARGEHEARGAENHDGPRDRAASNHEVFSLGESVPRIATTPVELVVATYRVRQASQNTALGPQRRWL